MPFKVGTDKAGSAGGMRQAQVQRGGSAVTRAGHVVRQGTWVTPTP
ncbi:hypothetical protein [Xylella fastidiosa]|nr:hypothetical protein [Xylella fastidiosa]MDD0928634.1 hypothetical protein [Xylella fastidiosa subsp. multiplex]QTX27776.1 hypothetical protein KBP49_09580 [Xylella fastidiosa subsp. multiplex]